MYKDVKILVTTNINYDNSVNEKMNIQYNGKLYLKGNDWVLRYKENLNQDQGDTWTVIRWNNNQIPYTVTLVRQGDIKMKQIFQEGYKYISHYKGQFGIIYMETITNHINLSKNEYGGRICIDYDMELNYQISGNYLLEIDYINQ